MSGFLSRLKASDQRAPHDDFWYRDVGIQTTAGISVTAESAMQSSAVFACVRVLSESIASLPVHVYRNIAIGKEKATDHPLFNLLHWQPNAWQTAFEYWEMKVAHVAMRGRAYSLIETNGRGEVTQLFPMHPDAVKVKQLESGRRVYEFTNKTAGTKAIFTQDEVFHLAGLSLDGIDGVSPITYARNSIGLALATEEHGARLFSNGTQLGSVFETEQSLKAEAVKEIKSQLAELHGGVGNSHKPFVAHSGLKLTTIGMTSEDAQFLETRKYQVSDIARIFRVPPHLIADLEKATFSNIEHQDIGFAKHTVRPWLKRIEQAVQRDLVLEQDKYFVEFQMDALMRGDLKSRYDAYGKGIQDGHLTRNEARELENRNPIDGLDEPLVPLNMAASSEDQDIEEDSENADSVANQFIDNAAASIVHKEVTAISKNYCRKDAMQWLEEFYSKLEKDVCRKLLVSEEFAKQYCDDSLRETKENADEPLSDYLERLTKFKPGMLAAKTKGFHNELRKNS